MLKQKILTDLYSEQEVLIPAYCEKWRLTENSMQPIDRDKAAKAIKTAYQISGFAEPEIWFYSNPLQAIQSISDIEGFLSYLGRDLHIKFLKRVFDHLQHLIERQLSPPLFIRLRNQTLHPSVPYYPKQCNSLPYYFPGSVLNCLKSQLIADFTKLNPELEYSDISYFTSCLARPAEWAIWACMFDFCISVLKLSRDIQKWQVIQQLIHETGFLFPYERVCIACERPSRLSFDEDNLLHASGQPALKFADNYSV